MNCTALNLSNLSAPFRRLSPRALQAVKTSLLCSALNAGGLGVNIIAGGSKYGGASTFNLTVLPLTTYIILWGANDLSMSMGGVTYTSGGAGTMTTVYTKSNVLMVFTGTFAGTSVTAKVMKSAGATPIPSGWSFSLSSSGTQAVASWDAPPSQVTATEVWTSSDNVTFALAGTVTAPGTSLTLTGPALNAFVYAKARWIGIQTGTFTAVLLTSGTVGNWITRVIANGGAAPAATTTNAMNNLVSTLVGNGIWSKLLLLNVIAPDNIIACATPLIKGGGSDPWVNHNCVDADVTINGVKGNGTTKFFDSSWQCNTNWALNNNGVSLYLATTGSFCEFGTDGASLFDQLSASDCTYDSQNLRVTTVTSGPGFYSGNRVSNVDSRIYYAKSSSAIAQLGATQAGAAGGLTDHSLYLLALNASSTATFFSTSRISFAATHSGLSITDAGKLFTAAQAYRVAIGGGFA